MSELALGVDVREPTDSPFKSPQALVQRWSLPTSTAIVRQD